MSAKVYIPTTLREITGGKPRVDTVPGSVRHVLQQVLDAYPAMTPRLYDEGGKLHGFVNVYVNDTEIEDLQGLETAVPDGAEVSIVPALAGGAR
jgi:molybdopterin converting factor small subunit